MTAEFERLLQEFAPLPKVKKEPTFLELCKYPGSRFEEICSRLLCFYFSPTKEHELGDLFIRCLFGLLKPDDEIVYNKIDVKVISEDNAEGKRVDILIYSNQFVIGIENKINASLYNPLEIYKSRIEKYSVVNKYCVVLSLRKIENKEEKSRMEKYNFVNITYKQLFDRVNAEIETYQQHLSNQYILYLRDFIKTLNNMTGQNTLDQKLIKFFQDNSGKIEELIDLYNEFQSGISKIQGQRVVDIKNRIESETSYHWDIYGGYLLVAQVVNSDKVMIGLEANYEEINGDPLGVFYFYIVTWSLNAWNTYENDLIQQFPHVAVSDRNPGKCSMLIDSVFNNDEEQIFSKLKKYFSLLLELTKNE
jgi:hypothetical protein